MHPTLLLTVQLFNRSTKRKGPVGPVGIKNSWKYEKDLTTLNLINTIFTINQLCYICRISYCLTELVLQ